MARKQIELLKRTIAKGTDNDQFMLFMQVCQKHGLDPFVKEVYCVLWPISKHHQDEKGIWVSGHDMVIITGIGGYRKMAARDHKDYAGSSNAEFTWFDPKKFTPAGREIPESATVKIHRRGAEDTVATVYWEEIAPADLKAPRSDFWNRMPKNQLEKCAEAKGLRKAFPGLGDIFTEEEMSQRLADFTPGGRQIVDSEGFAPSGRAVTYAAQTGSAEAAAEVLQKKLAAHASGKPIDASPEEKAPLRPSQARETASGAVGAKGGETTVPGYETSPAAPDTRPMIEVDWANEASPIVRGELENFLEMLQKHCTATWKDEWWHVLPKDVETIRKLCADLGFRLQETMPRPKPPSSGPKKAMTPPEHPTAQGGSTGPSGAPAVVKGVIEQFNESITANKKVPKMAVLLKTDKGKVWMSTFNHDLMKYLPKGVGKECELIVKTTNYGPQIQGIKRIGNREFDEDGKTPVIQRDEPRGGSLFGD